MKYQKIFSGFNCYKAFVVLVFVFFCFSCSQKPLIICSSSPEFAFYIEDFNLTHPKTKALLVYSENPALEVSKSTKQDIDIVIGSYLLNKDTKKYFKSLNGVLANTSLQGQSKETSKVAKNDFYPALLKYCKIGAFYRLLPVSFNLSAIIFNKSAAPLVDTHYNIDIARIKTIAAGFNKKNTLDVFTQIGFAPSWDAEFLYSACVLLGVNYRQKGDFFDWNEEALNNFYDFIKQWTLSCNDSTLQEQDFSFKYLYTPPVAQVLLGHNLFSFVTSANLFTYNTNRLKDIDFRWLSNYDKIMVQDDIVTLGLLKKSKNKAKARQFIKWFFSQETQKDIFEKWQQKNLTTQSFGIAGGFSSLQTVNEKVLTPHYQSLIGNTPQALTLLAPNPLPAQWKTLKTKIILPVLKDNTDTTKTAPTSMQQKIEDSSKL